MTEPLLMALTALAAWLGVEAFRVGDAGSIRRAGFALAAAAMTRYEAWPFTAALLALGPFRRFVLDGPRESIMLAAASRSTAAAALAFVVLSRATVGEWFVKSGFFIAENPDLRRPLAALVSVWWGTHQLTSYRWPSSCGGLAVLLARSLRSRDAAHWLPPRSGWRGGAPLVRVLLGPPVPDSLHGPACPCGWTGCRLLRRDGRPIEAARRSPGPRGGGGGSGRSIPPPDGGRAQWDRTNQAGRPRWRPTSGTVERGTRHGSMGSLAHFMQELSREGFRIRDFLHEGNETSGLPRSSTRTLTPNGCSSRNRRKGATCSRRGRAPVLSTWRLCARRRGRRRRTLSPKIEREAVHRRPCGKQSRRTQVMKRSFRTIAERGEDAEPAKSSLVPRKSRQIGRAHWYRPPIR